MLAWLDVAWVVVLARFGLGRLVVLGRGDRAWSGSFCRVGWGGVVLAGPVVLVCMLVQPFARGGEVATRTPPLPGWWTGVYLLDLVPGGHVESTVGL